MARLGSFLALKIRGDASTLGSVAARVVASLDTHRAPPSETELARRKRANLTPAQEENLARWGYPYVFNEFQFHITLTGPLPRAQHDIALKTAQDYFTPYLPEPFVMDGLTLVGEHATDERFYEIERFELSGQPE